MSTTWKMTYPAVLLAAALVVANVTHAQAPPATPARATAQAKVPAKAQQAGPEASFRRWDKDKNNALSMDEFKTGWQEVQGAIALQKLRANFVAMDANKSNGLEAAEYATLELIKRAGKSAPQMSAFDADKNQQLSFKEYAAMVGSMLKTQQ